VPGLLMTAVLMAMTAWLARRRSIPAEIAVPLRELPNVTFRALPVLFMPVILLAGIYGGATTPTEAAAVAAAYALLLAALVYRSVTRRSLHEILVDSARSSASIGLVIGGALIFNYIVASENIPNTLAAFLDQLELSPLAFMLLANVLVLLLGCILDATTIILVILPLFIPACRALGIDLVHFGVVMVVNCMIGLITPPYGILLFVINATTGIAINDIVREVLPFLCALLVALAIMVLVPETVLWLPRLLGYRG
jgi:tripartite ATP-independent transporter DctM subunit